jgi:hypothetical protein
VSRASGDPQQQVVRIQSFLATKDLKDHKGVSFVFFAFFRG